MTQPSEEEVRALLTYEAERHEHIASLYRDDAAAKLDFSEETAAVMLARAWVYRHALALLDAGRKDRERLDWIDGKSLDGIHVEVWAKGNADIRVEREACVYWRNVEVKCDNVRAAIDQARGA